MGGGVEKGFEKVIGLVLERLEGFLEQQESIDPQKCKHITGALKDIRDLQREEDGAKQIMVVFDTLTEEAAQ